MKKILALLATMVVAGQAFAGPVNVNTADADAISMQLKGVGLSKARAIVEYREEYGAYAVPEDLLKVKGIGPKVISDNAGDILVAD